MTSLLKKSRYFSANFLKIFRSVIVTIIFSDHLPQTALLLNLNQNKVACSNNQTKGTPFNQQITYVYLETKYVTLLHGFLKTELLNLLNAIH